MSKGKGVYDRELSESLPELTRSISERLVGVFRRVASICARFALPIGVVLCVSLAVGVIAFINWYRTPPVPLPKTQTNAPEIQKLQDLGGDLKEVSEDNPDAATSAYGGEFREIVTSGGIHIDLEKVQASRSTKAFAQGVLPKLFDACPGLNDYAPDLWFAGLNDMSSPIFKESSGIGLKFKMADKPSIAPGRFGGQICEFRITPDRRILIIQKTTCAEVCLERDVESTGRDLRYRL